MKIALSVNRQRVVNSKSEGKQLRTYAVEHFDTTDADSLVTLLRVLTHHNHTFNVFNGPRKAAHCIGVNGVMLDIDDGNAPLDELAERFALYACVIYSTSSHTEDNKKWRVLLPFASTFECNEAHARAMYKWCQAKFPDVDQTCFEPGRHLFPCCEPARSRFQHHIIEGAHIEPRVIETSTKKKIAPEGWNPPLNHGGSFNKERLAVLLEHTGLRQGDHRDNYALLLAIECGFAGVDIKSTLDTWNSKNVDQLPAIDIDRIIAQSRHYPHGFGFNSKEPFGSWVKEAHDEVMKRRGNVTQKLTKPKTHLPEVSPQLADEIIDGILKEKAKRAREALRISNLLRLSNRTRDEEVRAALTQTMADILADDTLAEDEDQLCWLAFRQRLSLFYCFAKQGKSTMGTSQAVDMIESGYRVLLVSLEEGRGDLKKRALAMSVDPERVWPNFHVITLTDIRSAQKKDEKKLDTLERLIEHHIKYHHIDCVITDSLSAHLTSIVGLVGKHKVNTADAEELSAHVRFFKTDIAERHNIAVVLLAHTGKNAIDENKAFDSNKPYKPRGSSGYADAVDIMIYMGGTKRDVSRPIWYDGRWKQADIQVRYDESTGRFIQAHAPAGFETAQDRQRATQLELACAFLREQLANGARVKPAALIATAKKGGVCGRTTLHEAADVLRIDKRADDGLWGLSPVPNPNDLIEDDEEKGGTDGD